MRGSLIAPAEDQVHFDPAGVGDLDEQERRPLHLVGVQLTSKAARARTVPSDCGSTLMGTLTKVFRPCSSISPLISTGAPGSALSGPAVATPRNTTMGNRSAS